jgi:hypothetical protein
VLLLAARKFGNLVEYEAGAAHWSGYAFGLGVPAKQIAETHAESFGHGREQIGARDDAFAFPKADIGTMDAQAMSQFALREARRLTKCPEAFAPR